MVLLQGANFTLSYPMLMRSLLTWLTSSSHRRLPTSSWVCSWQSLANRDFAELSTLRTYPPHRARFFEQSWVVERRNLNHLYLPDRTHTLEVEKLGLWRPRDQGALFASDNLEGQTHRPLFVGPLLCVLDACFRTPRLRALSVVAWLELSVAPFLCRGFYPEITN